MADVFGADVWQFEAANSACLGAALRALHGDTMADGRRIEWDDVIRGVAEPMASSRVRPDPSHGQAYRELMQAYAACEADALRR